eukprot:8671246-Pyramimonas_sp.AAC.1
MVKECCQILTNVASSHWCQHVHDGGDTHSGYCAGQIHLLRYSHGLTFPNHADHVHTPTGGPGSWPQGHENDPTPGSSHLHHQEQEIQVPLLRMVRQWDTMCVHTYSGSAEHSEGSVTVAMRSPCPQK